MASAPFAHTDRLIEQTVYYSIEAIKWLSKKYTNPGVVTAFEDQMVKHKYVQYGMVTSFEHRFHRKSLFDKENASISIIPHEKTLFYDAYFWRAN